MQNIEIHDCESARIERRHVVGEKDGKKYDFYAYKIKVDLGGGVTLSLDVDTYNKAIIKAGEKFGGLDFEIK